VGVADLNPVIATAVADISPILSRCLALFLILTDGASDYDTTGAVAIYADIF
jgi:hypothetical protein